MWIKYCIDSVFMSKDHMKTYADYINPIYEDAKPKPLKKTKEQILANVKDILKVVSHNRSV